ncbi:hypothetical protein [Oceanicaulis sp.]|uniref:hypothetical protein n=1 Tax=Oceanicaulis sp. TaxID=1924941 RepID=UPI003D2C785C
MERNVYNLDGKWALSLTKIGLPTGRIILLRARNLTSEELLPLKFVAKIKSDGIITDRLRRSFGVLLPGETEELRLVKATGDGKKSNAGEHRISLYFDQAAIEFSVNSMGASLDGEIPNRDDMFTKSILDTLEDDD